MSVVIPEKFFPTMTEAGNLYNTMGDLGCFYIYKSHLFH